MHPHLRSPWSVLALALVSLAPLRAGVTVVAPAGGDYTSIAAAVAAAPAGEILLVKSGDYGPFTIDGKSLHVVADAGALVTVQSPVRVANLAATQTVTLQGLEVRHFAQAGVAGLVLTMCAGPVRLDRCRVVPMFGILLSPASPTFHIVGCASVALESCQSEGAYHSYFSSGVPGLQCSSSTLSLHDCNLTGARGRNGLSGGQTGGGPNQSGSQGRPGLECVASVVFVSGGVLTGGPGGLGLDGDQCGGYTFPTSGGQGGPGLHDLGGSTITALGAQFVGGPGGVSGTGPAGCLPPPRGPTGPATWPASLSIATLAGTHRSLGDVLPTREGSSVQLEFHGAPGDHVYLALAAGRAHAFEPILNGLLLVQPPFRRLFLGTADGTGTLLATVPVSDLGTGVEGLVRNVQGIFVDAGGTRWTSGANACVLLDAGF